MLIYCFQTVIFVPILVLMAFFYSPIMSESTNISFLCLQILNFRAVIYVWIVFVLKKGLVSRETQILNCGKHKCMSILDGLRWYCISNMRDLRAPVNGFSCSTWNRLAITSPKARTFVQNRIKGRSHCHLVVQNSILVIIYFNMRR